MVEVYGPVRRPRTRFVASLALLLAILLGVSPAGAEKPTFHTYAGDRDLSSLGGACMVQDKAGYILVCTELGLFAYDGRRFVNLGLAQGLRRGGLLSDIVLTDTGRIAVRFANEVLVSDRGTDSAHPPTSLRFRPVAHPGVEMFDERSHLMTSWHGDLVMLAGTATVRIVVPAQGEAHLEAMGYSPEEERLLFNANHVFAVDGHLWEAFRSSRLCMADPGAVKCYDEADGLHGGMWHDVVADGGGRILARSPLSVATFDPQAAPSWSVIDLPDQANRLSELHSGLGLFRAPDGSLLTQADHGIVVRGRRGWRLMTVQDGAPAGPITSALTDATGQLWFQIEGRGLVRWIGFGQWEAVQKADGLSDGFPWRSTLAPDGTLWVATDTGVDAVGRVGEAPRVTQVLPGAAFAIAMGPRGELWRGNFNDGVAIVDTTTLTRRLLKLPAVNAILHGTGDIMWLGSETGLYKVDDRPDGVLQPQPQGALRAVVHDMVRDGAGGVFYLARGRLRHCSADGKDAEMAGQWPGSSFDPVSIAADASGNLWIGGLGGLYRFTPAGSRLEAALAVPMEDTRSSNVVAVLVDHRGWVWAGTPAGLSVFDGTRWVSADSDGGLVSDDVDEGGLTEDRDGSIWVATTQGLSHLLDPASLFADRPVRVVISQASLGNRVVDSGMLPYSHDPLLLQFGTPNSAVERSFLFRYKLLGVDDEWAETASGLVRYPSLPPGHHVLVVVGFDQLTRRSSAPATLTIDMAYPWWQQWWAQILAGLAVGCVGWGLIHLRFRTLLAREAELLRRVEAATRALQYQASHDSLTGLLNRSEIEARLASRLVGTLQDGSVLANEEMIIALVDIDHFKRVNDSYGHLGGDDVLRTVGRLVSKMLRPTEYAGRYGGEEVLLVLSDADGRGAERVLELHHVMRGMGFAAAGHEIRLTCSIGVAWARRGDNWESLIGRADDALYRAKNSGRDRVVESGRLSPPAESVAHERRVRPNPL